MSHYSLGVITRRPFQIEELLYHYSEDNATEEEIDDDGETRYYNPDYRFDWYQVGGRWHNMLKVSKATTERAVQGSASLVSPSYERRQRGRYRWVDGAPIKDILWSHLNAASTKQIKELSDDWDARTAEDTIQAQLIRHRYLTKANYIMLKNLFVPHATLVDDQNDDVGRWFEEIDDDYESMTHYYQEFYNIISNPDYQDYYLVIVDCHD